MQVCKRIKVDSGPIADKYSASRLESISTLLHDRSKPRVIAFQSPACTLAFSFTSDKDGQSQDGLPSRSESAIECGARSARNNGSQRSKQLGDREETR